MKITTTTITERQCARFYKHKKKKNADRFYIQKGVHFAKSNTIPVLFLYTKERHFTLSYFHEMYEVRIYIQERIVLCVTGIFYMKKARHFAKSKTICVRFLC